MATPRRRKLPKHLPMQKGVGTIKQAVHIQASLEREYDSLHEVLRTALGDEHDDSDVQSVCRKLYVDGLGNIIGIGDCGNHALVCTPAELPVLVQWLEQIRDGQTGADGNHPRAQMK